MRTAIEMPRLGYGTDKGRISSWLKRAGDQVRRGEAIAEIETDKAVVEMEATITGTLVDIVVGPGVDVPIGEVIGYIDEGS